MARSSSVKVYLSTVTTGFQRGLRQAENMLSSFGKKVKGVFSKISSALTSTMGMIGIGLGVAGIKSAIADLDKMAKASRNLGVTGEYFQKLTFAADRSGVAVEKVFGAFARMKKGAAEASTGNKQMAEHFQRLGLSVDDLRRMNPEQMFDSVVERLNKMQDPLERDAVAAGLFGRSFAELNVFLRDYKDLGQELEERGGIIKNEELAAAEKFDDTLTNVANTVKSMAFNSGFITMLNDAVEALQYLMGGEDKAAKQAAAKSGGTVLTRQQAFDLARNSGKLTPVEMAAFNSTSGNKWVNTKYNGRWGNAAIGEINNFAVIDAAMKRLGMGSLSGSYDTTSYKSGYAGRYSYTTGGLITTLPKWAGFEEKQAEQVQKAQAAKKKREDDRAAAEAAARQRENSAALASDEAAMQEAVNKASDAAMLPEIRRDQAIAEMKAKSELDALKQIDPLAAYVKEFESKYGAVNDEQKAQLEEFYRRETPDEIAKEAEDALAGGTLGAWGGDNLDRQLASAKMEERTAKATEETVQVLKEIKNKDTEGLTYI